MSQTQLAFEEAFFSSLIFTYLYLLSANAKQAFYTVLGSAYYLLFNSYYALTILNNSTHQCGDVDDIDVIRRRGANADCQSLYRGLAAI